MTTSRFNFGVRNALRRDQRSDSSADLEWDNGRELEAREVPGDRLQRCVGERHLRSYTALPKRFALF